MRVSHHRSRALAALGITVTMVVFSTCLAGASTSDGSSTPQPAGSVTPSGPPAPANFASTLETMYAEASSYAGLPGGSPHGTPAETAAPMSPAAFDQLIANQSQSELNAVYDMAPDRWATVAGDVQKLSTNAPPSAVQAKLAQAYAALASRPKSRAPRTVVPAPGAAQTPAQGPAQAAVPVASPPAYSPPAPTVYAHLSCPNPSLGTEDGDDLLFGLTIAQDAEGILEQIPNSYVALVAIPVFFALQIPVDTVTFEINIVEYCLGNDEAAEVGVIDGNIAAAQSTAIAITALDQATAQLEADTQQLLDSRTQTIITKLNTAQHSLDQAQTQAIEEALAGGSSTAVASYELPATLGGYLDSTPIGVQAIVTNALALLQQAQQPINPAAPKDLTAANNALQSGQYKQAFFDFQAAYQALNH